MALEKAGWLAVRMGPSLVDSKEEKWVVKMVVLLV